MTIDRRIVGIVFTIGLWLLLMTAPAQARQVGEPPEGGGSSVACALPGQILNHEPRLQGACQQGASEPRVARVSTSPAGAPVLPWVLVGLGGVAAAAGLGAGVRMIHRRAPRVAV